MLYTYAQHLSPRATPSAYSDEMTSKHDDAAISKTLQHAVMDTHACLRSDLIPCIIHGHSACAWVDHKVKHHALDPVPIFALLATAQDQRDRPVQARLLGAICILDALAGGYCNLDNKAARCGRCRHCGDT